METKKEQSKQNDNVALKKLRNYITLYHTYRLLRFKEQIQMRKNRSSKNIENKQTNNRVIKMTNFIPQTYKFYYIISYLPTNIVKTCSDNKYSYHHKCGKKKQTIDNNIAL